MSIWYKLGEIKDEIAWQTGKTFNAAKDSVEDGVFNAKLKVGSLKDEAIWKASNLSYSASDLASDLLFDLKYDRSNIMTNMYERGSIATSEKAMKILFPAIGARVSADRLRNLSSSLASKISLLNNLLEEKDTIERKVALEFENGGIVRQKIRASLNEFCHEFAKLDNQAQYKLKNIQTKFNLEMPIEAGGTIQFSNLDSTLLKIYDEDFNMLSIFKQSPVTAAIIQLREKSLSEGINDSIYEVEQCIKNVELINFNMSKLYTLTHNLNGELVKTHLLLTHEIKNLTDLIKNSGNNTIYYGEKEALVIDNALMMFALTVRLMNTPIYSKEEVNTLNSDFVQHVIEDSEQNLIQNYGSDVLESIGEEYEQMTSLTFKDGVSLISVQKLEKCRSVRRHENDLLVGYVSHYNRGNTTSYSLLSQHQSYDQVFAEHDVYNLTEQVKNNPNTFNEEHYIAYINQVESKLDLFTDFSGRYILLNRVLFGQNDEIRLYDTRKKQGVKIEIDFTKYISADDLFFSFMGPSFNIISSAILPISENKAEIILIGYLGANEASPLYLSYIYENGIITEKEGRLKKSIDSINQQLQNQIVVNIVTAENLEHFVYQAIEQEFVDRPYQTIRENVINMYSIINGEIKLLKAPRKVMLDKVNLEQYINQFAFNYDDHLASNNMNNYLHRFLGFGLRNKVTIAGNRMFILDYYSDNGSYQLARGEWDNHDFVLCQQRILEFDIVNDELLKIHDIGVSNPNVHEILYHNNRLYALDVTNGLLIYTI